MNDAESKTIGLSDRLISTPVLSSVDRAVGWTSNCIERTDHKGRTLIERTVNFSFIGKFVDEVGRVDYYFATATVAASEVEECRMTPKSIYALALKRVENARGQLMREAHDRKALIPRGNKQDVLPPSELSECASLVFEALWMLREDYVDPATQVDEIDTEPVGPVFKEAPDFAGDDLAHGVAEKADDKQTTPKKPANNRNQAAKSKNDKPIVTEN